MHPTIREIQPKDDAEIGKLIKTVLTEFKANKPGTAYFDEHTNHLSTLFKTKNSGYWVVEKDGVIIGGGGIFPTEGLPADTCELVKLYLKQTARGKGLGVALMDKCFAKARSLGYQKIYLESMPELNQAVSLYEQLGFERQHKPLGNSGHFGCDIWMVKAL